MQPLDDAVSIAIGIIPVIRSWVYWLGGRISEFFGLSLNENGNIILGTAAIGLGVFVLTVISVSIARALAEPRSLRRFRAQFESDADAKRLRSIKSHHDIAMLKIQQQQQKRAIQLDQQWERLERANQVRFREVGFLERVKDRCSALLAATSKDALLPLQVRRYFYTLDHTGYSILRARARAVGQHIASLNAQQRSAISQLRQTKKGDESDHAFLKQMVDRVEKQISEHESPEDDEVSAQRSLKQWEAAVGRPVFIERFVSFFERNVAEWRRSLGHEGAEQVLREDGSTTQVESLSRLPVRLFSSVIRWLRSDVFNLIKLFPVLAVPAEFAFSYPIFMALTNGDAPIAIAGAAVFTIGLLTVGNLAGRSLLRMRSHKVVENPQLVLVVRWRFIAVLAAALFIAIGSAGVYTGATLRQNAGEVLRLGGEISNLRDEIVNLEKRRTSTIRPGGAEEQAGAELQRLIDLRRGDVERLSNERVKLIHELRSPFGDPEGRMALVIFAIFFISAVARKIFDHDPVYEYSRSELRASDLRQDRLHKLLILQAALAAYELIRQQLGKRLELIKDQIELIERNEDGKVAAEELEKSKVVLEEEIRSYVHARCLAFCTTLGRFRDFGPESVDTLLTLLREEADGVRKGEPYKREDAA